MTNQFFSCFRPGLGTARSEWLNRSSLVARTLSLSVAAAMLASTSGTAIAADKSSQPFVLTNGKIYTGDTGRPWAEAVAIRDHKIVFVGSSAEAKAQDSKARVVDLHGAFVMPGMVDAHTHPGMVSMLGPADDDTDASMALPNESKEALFAWLRNYAAKHPNEKAVVLGSWDVALFLPDGPSRKDLDAIWPNTPALLFDNTGHSYWANSTALKLLGVGPDAKDLVPGVSTFARDENGEPTGWLKEFVVTDRLAQYWTRPDAEIERRMAEFLNFLASNGVTSLWDAGNYGLEDTVYRVLAKMDRADKLPVRYFGSYHIWDQKQYDVAVDKINRLQKKYGSKNLIFNTVKIHFDGISEIGTAGEYEPFANSPNNRGGTVSDTDRLAKFMVDLDKNGINVHLHTIGDRASDIALNAVEQARKTLGRPLRIMVTLCHLETVRPENFKRFKELNVTANFTPNWFGATLANKLTVMHLGPERAARQFQAGTMVRSGANVSMSSDILSSDATWTTAPLLGLQSSMTRQYAFPGAPAAPADQPNELLTLPQAIEAYTAGGAKQLTYGDKTGSIQVGKLADLVVMDKNAFDVSSDQISQIKVKATLMDGEVTGGALE